MRASSTWPSMEGTLFTYYRDEYVNRVAFRSGNKAHKRHVVLIGGLGVSGRGGAVAWREGGGAWGEAGCGCLSCIWIASLGWSALHGGQTWTGR